MADNFQVIYLTGAPAAGKSTLTRELARSVDGLEVFEYGARLTAYLNEARTGDLEQTQLRTLSGRLARPEDIDAVDDRLLEFVEANRTRRHVIIDSHPVTKEDYGYRVTPFSLERFATLRPTQIWVLYTAPEVTVERIRSDAGGRPTITVEEARLHTHLQGAVATTYGMHVGRPIYFFDTGRDLAVLAAELAARLRRG